MLDTIAELKTPPKIAKLDVLFSKIFTPDPVVLLEAQKLQKIYGNIYSFASALTPSVFITSGAEEIAHIHKNTDIYIKKYSGSSFESVFVNTFGGGILPNSGKKYDDRRKNMLSIFKMANLKNNLDIIQDSIDKYIAVIKQDISSQEGKAIINIDKYSTLMCLDIAAKVFFNIDLGGDIEEIHDISKFLNKSFRTPFYLVRKQSEIKKNQERLKYLIRKRFISNKTQFDEKRIGLLDCFENYQGDPQYSYKNQEEVLGEIITLLITGHETSALSIVYAIALLELDKDYKTLVTEEIDSLYTKNLEYQDLKNYYYTKLWIEENLRLYPPIWFTIRYLTEQDVINGHYIPAKSYILSNFFVLHRNPDYWDNPNQFNPFRFTEENKAKQYKNSFLPFAAGPRTCIASNFAMIEIQLILIKLLQNFKFEKIPGTSVKLDPCISLRMTESLKMYAEIK